MNIARGNDKVICSCEENWELLGLLVRSSYKDDPCDMPLSLYALSYLSIYNVYIRIKFFDYEMIILFQSVCCKIRSFYKISVSQVLPEALVEV